MVDYVFERHLSGGLLPPADKTASTSRPSHIALTERFRVGKRTLAERECERAHLERAVAREHALDDET